MRRVMATYCKAGAGGPGLWGWLLWVALVCGCASVAQAASSQRSGATSPDWASASAVLPLTPHVHYLKEAPGEALEWWQARDSALWQASNAKGMAALHGATTMWLRLQVRNTGAVPVTRLVAPDHWALHDVQLFVLEVDGRTLLAHERAGLVLAPEERALKSAQPAFAVTLAPGQHVQLLLRVSDQYWRHVQIDAWEDAAFVHAQMLPRLGFAAISGAALALCVVLLLMRSQLLAITAVWVLLSLALELALAGLLPEVWPLAWVWAPSLLILSVGCLTSCASAFVTMHFMGLERHPFWSRWNWGMVATSLALIWLIHDSHSYLLRQGMLLFTILQVVSNMTMLGSARLRGYPWRQWMVALLLVNFVVAVGRVVLHQFYVEPETYDLLMSVIMGIKAVRVLMVVGLVALQRNSDTREVRQRLLAAERRQREDLQAAVQQRTADLRQALLVANEANSAKNDFLARVSHDLRSPLTSINGYAQLLQRMGGRTGQLAQTIRHSAEHMQAMVNDLIDFARGDLGEQPILQPVYIHRLLDDVATQAAALAQRQGNRFTMTLETELPPVLLLDAKRLQQMLMNLLENAAKFTRHGQVTLKVAAMLQGGGQMLLRLSVCDTGVGISASDQVRLFEPFFRGARTEGVKGSGLGLSIVQTWAHRLGGTVTVQSVPGQGATFTLRLPVEMGSEADMAPPQKLDDVVYLPALDGGGRRAWVIEDNEDIRALLAEELRATGFEVQTFADGTDVITYMRGPESVAPSVVLTDYLMPGADGAAVLRAVRKYWPGVPVVLLSATQKTMQSLGVARDEGFDASLAKPLNLADLRVTLAEVLGLAVAPDMQETQPMALDDAGPQVAAWVSGLRLTADELTRIREWVDMGALTDLTEWAEALARRRPDCADFAARMLTLLSMARLDEVRVLCEAAAERNGHD